MTPLSYFAVYFVVWWLCLFLVLPWGARSQVDADEIVPGTEPGAPAVMRYWRKLLATTVLSAVVVLLIFWVVTIPALQEYWS
jgi:predicted secreted protein